MSTPRQKQTHGFFTHQSRKVARKRSVKKALGLESLEGRELMAADLGFNAQISSGLNRAIDQAIVQLAPSDPFGSGGLGGGISFPGDAGEPDQPPPKLLTTDFQNGVLTVDGSNDADHLYIYESDGNVHVKEVVKDRIVRTVPRDSLRSIVVHGNAGDDWIKIDPALNVPTSLYGEAGDDIIQGGAARDNIRGGDGSDQISGGQGNDVLRGDGGNDLLVGGDGRDLLFGGSGNDHLVGGDGNDWLAGEHGADQLFGEAGNDLLFGGFGDDMLDGQDGDDQLYGDAGDDALYGGEGNDFLRGMDGDDQLRGEAGNDDLRGDAGNDIIDGGNGRDVLQGDAGNDALIGGRGNDHLVGGAHHDWLYGGSGDDIVSGGEGNDVLQGAQGSDRLSGGPDKDQVFQEFAPGQADLELNVQHFIFGAIGDAIEDVAEAVWDSVVDVVNWTTDKIQAIGDDLYHWVTTLDDRLIRLGNDFTSALSHWPWEADFWKDMGRVVVDGLEIVGLGEIWEIAFEILKPWQRGLTQAEMDVARSVFGDSIPWNKVRLDEMSLMAGIGRTHVTGFIINSLGDINDQTLIHELTHVWQYVQDGLVYIPEAIGAQAGEGYEFGGIEDLREKKDAGQGMSAYNREQQGEIVRKYFVLRNDINDLRETGSPVPVDMQRELEVYIHFVKEVSTLTPEQLGARPSLASRFQVPFSFGQFQIRL